MARKTNSPQKRELQGAAEPSPAQPALARGVWSTKRWKLEMEKGCMSQSINAKPACALHVIELKTSPAFQVSY